MLHPAGAGAASGAGAGDKAVFERTMLPFNHAVALWVISRGQLPGNPKAGSELTPQLTSELTSTVRDDGVRRPKTRHPVPEKSPGAGFSRDV